jgi:hypothetical protein
LAGGNLKMHNTLKIFHLTVTGTKFKNADGTDRHDHIKNCNVGQVLTLIRDPDNKYDKNAIEVWTTDDRLQLGFIKEKYATDVAPLLDKGYQYDCKVEEIRELKSASKNNTLGKDKESSLLKKFFNAFISKFSANKIKTPLFSWGVKLKNNRFIKINTSLCIPIYFGK